VETTVSRVVDYLQKLYNLVASRLNILSSLGLQEAISQNVLFLKLAKEDIESPPLADRDYLRGLLVKLLLNYGLAEALLSTYPIIQQFLFSDKKLFDVHLDYDYLSLRLYEPERGEIYLFVRGVWDETTTPESLQRQPELYKAKISVGCAQPLEQFLKRRFGVEEELPAWTSEVATLDNTGRISSLELFTSTDKFNEILRKLPINLRITGEAYNIIEREFLRPYVEEIIRKYPDYVRLILEIRRIAEEKARRVLEEILSSV